MTSALDVNTEKEVLNNIYDYAKANRITTIISSQKPSSLAVCDRIIVMENGKLEQIGDKNTVEENSKIYRQILKLQTKIQ